MEEKLTNRPHKLTVLNRSTCCLTGLEDVVSFDESQVVLNTVMGLLTIKGKGLHVSRLTVEKGEIDINGTVDSFTYSSNEAYKRSGASVFSRLFK